MRSVIKQASEAGIKDIVNQQFELAAQIIAAELLPIVEPEVDIHCPEKPRPKRYSRRLFLRSSTNYQQASWSC
ncbi:MAG: Fructose-bisphosphate aldolase class 1 [Candidatus Udaeobacter sp.]|nr:MAG: Fructose-bisphosphate aldolase class 1 [Candidatus Udaeobacter sp.]